MKKLKYLFFATLLLLGGNVMAQSKVITGKVTNATTGEAMQGVSILVDKKKGAVLTKQDGTYSVTVPAGSSTLIFSFVNFAPQTVVVDNKTTVDIALVSTATQLNDVVVIGYGTQKRSSVTGAVAKFQNERLDESPVSRLDQALQGKIAGVQIQNTSSEAGSDPRISIRGTTSVNATASPLVVIDGQPAQDGLAFVNMADVESVEVLKDAASAAIYGSRGSAGVILITTKSGKTNKPRFTIKFSQGGKDPYYVYPLMSTSEYTNLLYYEASLRATDTAYTNYATAAQRAAKFNLISTPEKAAYIIENGLNAGIGTDWEQAALRTGNIRNADISVSGGTGKTKYFISGAYQNDQGMILHSEYQRFNVRSKLEVELSKKLKLNININPSYIRKEKPASNFTDFTRVTSYLPLTLNAAQAAFIRQSPAYAGVIAGDFAQPRMFNDLPYNGILPDGSVFSSTGAISVNSSANNSPYSILQNEKIVINDYRATTGLDLTYTIMPGLTFKTLVSAYVDQTKGLDFSKTGTLTAGAASKGVYTDNFFYDLLNENTFNYNKQIKDHSINILAGFTAEKKSTSNQQITGLNYLNDNITALNSAQSISVDPTATFSNVYKEGLLSYLGRASYAYKSKYLLNASFRADGSSNFAPGHKWGYFPSVSIGWVMSKEKFIQHISWIDNMKFRGSYGSTGNNRIVPYAYLDQLYTANYPTGGGNGTSTGGVVPSTTILADPTLTWETTNSFNGGLDVTLFKNAVSFSLDVYQSKTKALLLRQAALGFTGVPQTWNNIGRLQNNGIELEVTTNNIRKKDFTWSTSGNISHVKNKLLQLGGEAFLLNTGERVDVYQNIIGAPLVQYYNLKTDGVWKSQAEINAAIASGLTSPLSGYFAPGGLKFVDENHDNIIDLNDRVVLGNPYPDFTWGVTNNFKYKRFDLSFTFQGSQGGKVLNGDMFYNEARKYNKNFTANRWISPANPGDGKTPYFTNGYTNAWTQSDYILQDASYYALRELLVGYSLPAVVAKRLKMQSVRLYLSAQNLYYHFAKDYNGINPEARNTTGTYGTPLIDGYQRGAFPVNKTILVGFDLNF